MMLDNETPDNDGIRAEGEKGRARTRHTACKTDDCRSVRYIM